MVRGGDGQQHGALHALGFGDCDGAFDRALVPGDDHLAAAVVVGAGNDFTAIRAHFGFSADFARHVHFHAEQGGHRPLPRRHGALHGLAAQFQQPGGVGDGERLDSGQGAVFTQRMPGDQSDFFLDRDAALGLQHPQHGERDGHQGGLRVLGEGQFLNRAFEHQFRKLLLQNLINFLENRARRGESSSQIAAHADCLAALSGENKGVNRHVLGLHITAAHLA